MRSIATEEREQGSRRSSELLNVAWPQHDSSWKLGTVDSGGPTRDALFTSISLYPSANLGNHLTMVYVINLRSIDSNDWRTEIHQISFGATELPSGHTGVIRTVVEAAFWDSRTEYLEVCESRQDCRGVIIYTAPNGQLMTISCPYHFRKDGAYSYSDFLCGYDVVVSPIAEAHGGREMSAALLAGKRTGVLFQSTGPEAGLRYLTIQE